MRTKAQMLESLSLLEDVEAIEGFVHDGGMLGTDASDEVIVSITAVHQRRYTWRELDAFLDGVGAGKHLTDLSQITTFTE